MLATVGERLIVKGLERENLPGNRFLCTKPARDTEIGFQSLVSVFIHFPQAAVAEELFLLPDQTDSGLIAFCVWKEATHRCRSLRPAWYLL